MNNHHINEVYEGDLIRHFATGLYTCGCAQQLSYHNSENDIAGITQAHKDHIVLLLICFRDESSTITFFPFAFEAWMMGGS
jgi:hypothetical protein